MNVPIVESRSSSTPETDMQRPASGPVELSRRELIKGVALGGLATLAGTSLVGCASGASNVVAAGGVERHGVWRDSLGSHRIARIEHREVQNRWPRLVSRNARLGVHGWGRGNAVLIIHTDKGASGWGYAPGANGGRATELTGQYRGRPLTDVFDPAVGRQDSVPKEMDLALHDLAGVILDLPVYELIGGTRPVPTPLYSGMIYFDDIEPLDSPPGIEQVLFNAGADHAYGYRQMKIKVGRGNMWMPHDEGLKRDIEVTRALAEAYPDVRFLADANDGFTVADTQAFLDGIGDVELIFMEEPFRENVEGFTELRSYLESSGKKTLIADGEANPVPEELDVLIAHGLLDLHLSDLYGVGFTEWRRLMPSLIERGVLASPHNWGSRLKTVYTTHLASGLGNVLTIEGVTAFSKDIDFSDYDPDARGMVAPPKRPGFGLALR